MSAVVRVFPLGRMVGRARRAAHVWMNGTRAESRAYNLREMAEMTEALEAAGLGAVAIKQQLNAYNRLMTDEWCRHQQPLSADLRFGGDA